MQILVYEHVSGGGFADAPISTSILSEGFAMLRASVSDFKAAGHDVTVLLDSRVAAFRPELDAVQIVSVSSADNVQYAIMEAAEKADAILVVAPESGGLLQKLVECTVSAGSCSLNCSSMAIEEAANKPMLNEALKSHGIPVPESLVLDSNDGLLEIRRTVRDRIGFPLIVKPLDGSGCGGVSLVSESDQLAAVIAKVKLESSEKHFLAQEFVQGTAASVSLIATGDKALPMSLNKQNVVLSAPESGSGYEGGFVPLESSLKAEAFAVAEKTVSSLSGAAGYVGVDLVLTGDKPVVIEVNPRLTTSYVGLRQVADFNIAQGMLDAAVEGRLPVRVELKGSAAFSKLALPNPSEKAFQAMCRMQSVLSPPFPLSSNDSACVLVVSRGETAAEAESKLCGVKKQLQLFDSGGKEQR